MLAPWLLNFAVLSAGLFAAQIYYPPPESAGGWRRCASDEEVRNKAGMNPDKLRVIGQEHVQVYGGPWVIAIVRKGYLVAEWFGVPAMPATTARRESLKVMIRSPPLRSIAYREAITPEPERVNGCPRA
jgi:hypothetical protein